jgi:hypothetical protein
MRLYHFDLTRNVIDVETLAPWVLAQSPEQREVLAQQVAELTSNGRATQWCVYSTNRADSSANWSHELSANKRWHVAVVNDGRHTTMYIDGCLVVDNPLTVATGLTQLNLPWVLGGYEYGGSINQIFYGWIGDVRIVNRALSVNQFMVNR